MSSSLVDSIFGGGAEKAPTTELFDTQIDVPEPKSYPTAASLKKTKQKKRKKQQREEEETPSSQKEKKMSRKEANTEESTTKKGEEGEEVKDKDQEEDAAQKEVEDVDARTVFVGNLPLHYTRRKLQHLFLSSTGKIESTRIRSVAVSGDKVKLPPQHAGNQKLHKKVCANTHRIDTAAKQSVSGYVVFCDASSVEEALKKNNMAVPVEEDKSASSTAAVRHIRVDRVGKAASNYDAARSVFVGNLPYTADEESLQAHFNRDNNDVVEAVRIVRDPTTQLCKGFGYVLFSTKADAVQAIQTLDQSVYMKRKLRVQVCGKRYKNQQGATTVTKAERRLQRASSGGALQRVLTKQLLLSTAAAATAQKKKPKKKRGNSTTSGHRKQPASSSMSKRAASQAKAGKRTKKMEKRLVKGMGKTRKAATT